SRNARATEYLVHPQGNRPSQREFLDGRPVAYPVYGDATFKEVCLVVARANGLRECRLSFVEDRIADVDGYPMLELVFSDEAIGLQLTHRFHVSAEHDLVARSVSIDNRGTESLVLERALSAALPLPPGAYDALTLTGQWGREFELHSRALAPGKVTVESR